MNRWLFGCFLFWNPCSSALPDSREVNMSSKATLTNWISAGNNRVNALCNPLWIHFLTFYRRCTPKYRSNYNKIYIIFHRSAITLLIVTKPTYFYENHHVIIQTPTYTSPELSHETHFGTILHGLYQDYRERKVSWEKTWSGYIAIPDQTRFRYSVIWHAEQKSET